MVESVDSLGIGPDCYSVSIIDTTILAEEFLNESFSIKESRAALH